MLGTWGLHISHGSAPLLYHDDRQFYTSAALRVYHWWFSKKNHLDLFRFSLQAISHSFYQIVVILWSYVSSKDPSLEPLKPLSSFMSLVSLESIWSQCQSPCGSFVSLIKNQNPFESSYQCLQSHLDNGGLWHSVEVITLWRSTKGTLRDKPTFRFLNLLCQWFNN